MLSENKDTREGINTEIERRVSIISSRIIECFTVNRFEKTGLYQILNRGFILFQYPITLVLHTVNEGELKTTIRSALDPHDKQIFKKYYAQYSSQTGKSRLRDAIIFFNKDNNKNDIGISMHRRNVEAPDSSAPRKKYALIDINDDYSIYRMMLEKLIKQLDNDSQAIGMKNFAELMKCYQEDIASGQFKSIQDSYPTKSSELDHNLVEQIVKHNIEPIFERIYEELEGTVIVSPRSREGQRQADHLQNIIFSFKCFNLQATRYDPQRTNNKRGKGLYHYNPRIILVAKQYEHIWSSLERLHREQRGDNEIHLPRFKYVTADRWFWKKVKAKKFSDIIDAAKGQCDLTEKTFMDRCLGTGLVQFYLSPHDRPRSFTAEEQGISPHSPRDLNASPWRAVCQHYIFALLGQGFGPKQKLSLLSAPIRVNGAPFACATRVSPYESINPKNALVNTQTFDANQFFYNTVMGVILRRTRREMKKAYFLVLEQISAKAFSKFRSLYDDNVGFSLSKDQFERLFISSMNRQFRTICRVFPFPLIELFKSEGKAERKGVSLFVSRSNHGKRYNFPLNLTQENGRLPANPFFDRVGTIEYITIQEAINAINNGRNYIKPIQDSTT